MNLIYLSHCQNIVGFLKICGEAPSFSRIKPFTLEPLDRRTGLVGTRVP